MNTRAVLRRSARRVLPGVLCGSAPRCHVATSGVRRVGGAACSVQPMQLQCISHTSQRRWSFYDVLAQEDPFFARVRESDVYGIVVETATQVEAAVAKAGPDTPREALARETARPLYEGFLGLATVLSMDVIPARQLAAATIHEDGAASGLTMSELVFQREAASDPERFEPLTVLRLSQELRRIAHVAGWAPEFTASDAKFDAAAALELSNAIRPGVAAELEAVEKAEAAAAEAAPASTDKAAEDDTPKPLSGVVAEKVARKTRRGPDPRQALRLQDVALESLPNTVAECFAYVDLLLAENAALSRAA